MDVSPEGTPTRKVVLITGATGWLGQALARAFARAGYALALHAGRREAELRALAGELGGCGLVADLSEPAEAESLLARILVLSGRVDVVVNNAADYPRDTLDTLNADTFQRLVRLQAYAPLALTRALARHAAGRPPSVADDPGVVNIVDARVGDRDPHHASYLLAKGLLADLTRQCARTYAPTLRVNGVSPGALTRSTGPGPRVSGAAAAAPLGRLATPQAVAEAAVWLAGARHVTGEIVPVDGGRHLGARGR